MEEPIQITSKTSRLQGGTGVASVLALWCRPKIGPVAYFKTTKVGRATLSRGIALTKRVHMLQSRVMGEGEENGVSNRQHYNCRKKYKGRIASMLLYWGIGLAVCALALVVVVMMQPSDFRITRSAVLPASPQMLFGLVNNLREWEEWSPWAKLDPNARNTYAGPDMGVGAIFGWSGNTKVGEGQMTIIESVPAKLVRIQLEFRKPMKCTNITEFTFHTDANGTKVVWSMTGTNPFMGKLFNLIMNMDKLVGADFDKGLGNLKKLVEKPTSMSA